MPEIKKPELIRQILYSSYFANYFEKYPEQQEVFIKYAEKGIQMDKQRAVYLLLQLYVDCCGYSKGMRTIAWDGCWAVFEMHAEELGATEGDFPDDDFLEKINPNFTEAIRERYDIAVLYEEEDYLRICMMIVDDSDDEETNSAVCLGIFLLKFMLRAPNPIRHIYYLKNNI